MKVLVCGGRRFGYDSRFACDITPEEAERTAAERAFVRAYLYSWHATAPISVLIHGDATGTDRVSGKWAQDVGVQEVRCPANWKHFEKRAGFLRNAAMLLLQPDVVIAFPGGAGTADMMAQAGNKGIRVVPVRIPR